MADTNTDVSRRSLRVNGRVDMECLLQHQDDDERQQRQEFDEGQSQDEEQPDNVGSARISGNAFARGGQRAALSIAAARGGQGHSER